MKSRTTRQTNMVMKTWQQVMTIARRRAIILQRRRHTPRDGTNDRRSSSRHKCPTPPFRRFGAPERPSGRRRNGNGTTSNALPSTIHARRDACNRNHQGKQRSRRERPYINVGNGRTNRRHGPRTSNPCHRRCTILHTREQVSKGGMLRQTGHRFPA